MSEQARKAAVPKFNTILPISPKKRLEEYQPLRGDDDTRDLHWSDLHDCIMSNVFKQLNIAKDSWSARNEPDPYWGNPFQRVIENIVVERITAMTLRAAEEWMDRHLNAHAEPADPDAGKVGDEEGLCANGER